MLYERCQVKMSFLNIKDSKKRDAIVAEYLETMHRLKERNLQERAHDFQLKNEIVKSAAPIVESTKASTAAITKELKPIQDEMKAMNTSIQAITKQKEADEKEDMIHELDAAVAHLYGLSESQLRHIFETFHVGWDYEDRLASTIDHYHRLESKI